MPYFSIREGEKCHVCHFRKYEEPCMYPCIFLFAEPPREGPIDHAKIVSLFGFIEEATCPAYMKEESFQGK